MEQVLLVVQVLLAVALIGMVLIQRSDSDGFGLSGGSGNNLLSGRSTANLLTRTTAILAGLFIINSLALSVLAAHGRAPSIVDTIEQQAGDAKDAAPAVPVAGETKADKTDAKKVDEKAPERKPEEKAAPAVPAADADTKPAVEEKPVVAVKKVVKKAKVAAPADDEQSNSDSNDNQ